MLPGDLRLARIHKAESIVHIGVFRIVGQRALAIPMAAS